VGSWRGWAAGKAFNKMSGGGMARCEWRGNYSAQPAVDKGKRFDPARPPAA
jgi:hypothetical protein